MPLAGADLNTLPDRECALQKAIQRADPNFLVPLYPVSVAGVVLVVEGVSAVALVVLAAALVVLAVEGVLFAAGLFSVAGLVSVALSSYSFALFDFYYSYYAPVALPVVLPVGLVAVDYVMVDSIVGVSFVVV